MRKVINLVTLILIVLLALIIIFLFWPHNVKLELVGMVGYDFNKEGGIKEYMWYDICSDYVSEKEEVARNIQLPKINFSNNCLYVAGERQLKGINYNYFSRLVSQYGWGAKIYTGKGILSKERYSNKIFIYKTELIYVDSLESSTILE